MLNQIALDVYTLHSVLYQMAHNEMAEPQGVAMKFTLELDLIYVQQLVPLKLGVDQTTQKLYILSLPLFSGGTKMLFLDNCIKHYPNY